MFHGATWWKFLVPSPMSHSRNSLVKIAIASQHCGSMTISVNTIKSRIYGKNSRADELAKLKIGDQVKIIGHLRINQTKREVEVGVDDLVRVYTVDQVAKMEFERLYPRDLSAVASPLTT